MVRFLGPQPNIDHLKNEAKALRNQHRRRDPEICPFLKNLSRFKDASDQEILDAEVPLADFQYALAMEYGFVSWLELRNAITTNSPAGDYVPDPDKNALVLPNAVGGIDGWTNRFASSFTVALRYLGARTSYTTVMGDSGLAFVFQADSSQKPFGADIPNLDFGWMPLDQWGADLRLHFLGQVNGVAIALQSSDVTEFREDPALHYRKYYEAIVTQNLQQGRPVIAVGNDHHVVFGYDDGVPPLLGQLACSAEAVIARMDRFPWIVYTLGEKGDPIDRHRADLAALEFAVKLSRDEVDLRDHPGKSSGRKSWALWLQHLADEELRGPHYYHANTVGHLRLNRHAAADYLREMTARYSSPTADHLIAAAAKYDSVVSLLGNVDTSKEGFTKNIENSLEVANQALHAEEDAVRSLEKAINSLGI